MRTAIKVFAPASVSNVVVGFDHMGFALEQPGDEILIREGVSPGLKISKVTGAKGLSLDIDKNTAGVAARELLRHIGKEDRPLEMEIRKKMPIGSGLGSSAASAVGAVFAVNKFLKCGLEKRDLLPFAMKGEQSSSGMNVADNVAASMLGGLVLITDNAELDVHKLYIPKGLQAVVVHQQVQVNTRESRILLPEQVPFISAVEQASNAASFVYAMYNSDFALMRRCLKDRIVESHRADSIPYYDEMKRLAESFDVVTFGISGSGPSVFALCDNSKMADEFGEAAEQFLSTKNVGHTVYQSGINLEGVRLC